MPSPRSSARARPKRDQTNRRPYAELDAFSQSGLWSINVPKAFGGPEVSYKTLAQVVAIISAADPSIGQISQNHLGIVAAIRTVSDPEQQALLFGEVLKGTRFGNAFSEIGTPRATDFKTHFVDDGDHVIVRGKKFYSTGALLAHLVPIVALDGEGRAWYAIADRGAPGLTVIDDWSAFGQRTTASGTVLIDDVRVPKTHLVPAWKGYEQPRSDGAIFQIIQAAVDAGIAREAIDDTIAFVRTKTRPWVDSGQDRASDDPYTIQAIGELTIRLHAAEAILDKAGLALDEAVANPSAETVAAAPARRRRIEGAHHRDRRAGEQQAVRARRHPLDPGREQPRPALAQRPHPHPPRPGALEIRDHRQPRPQRREPAVPRLELTEGVGRRALVPEPSTSS